MLLDNFITLLELEDCFMIILNSFYLLDVIRFLLSLEPNEKPQNSKMKAQFESLLKDFLKLKLKSILKRNHSGSRMPIPINRVDTLE